jgi:hypothetical protein
MLSKTQFKEWFDRYKYAELSATTALLVRNLAASLVV